MAVAFNEYTASDCFFSPSASAARSLAVAARTASVTLPSTEASFAQNRPIARIGRKGQQSHIVQRSAFPVFR